MGRAGAPHPEGGGASARPATGACHIVILDRGEMGAGSTRLDQCFADAGEEFGQGNGSAIFGPR